MTESRQAVFLISPANLHGVRGGRLLDEESSSDLARRLRSEEGAGIAEVFSHISTLYFRGKVTYSRHFAGELGTRIIVPGFGLVAPDWRLDLERARRISECPVDPSRSDYREPLERDIRELAENESAPERVVFLGSLATRKYLDVLVPLLGSKLHYPTVFLGCGDMRRGSLLLKATEADAELDYSVWSDDGEQEAGE